MKILSAVLRSAIVPAASSALWASTALGQYASTKANFVVARPVVNMYSEPSLDGSVVSQSLYGSCVSTIEKKNGWVDIRTGDGYTGWVAESELTALGNEYAPPGKAVRVAALSANVYREPSVTKHAAVFDLPWESRLEVVPGKVDDGGRWLRVKLVNGETAYVQQGDVSADFTPMTVEQSLQLARRFLGITYTWGGVSAYGYDCSGFTQMLVRQTGIVMPRDADVQAKWSGLAVIERKDLQPGDLLFFGDSVEKITHTGMYIGGGEFIHDTVHGHPGIQISKLDDQPWTKILVAARRVKR